MRTWFVAACAAFALGACAFHDDDDPVPDQWRVIDVEAAPLAFGAEQVGELRFRGGLVLSSEFGWFGGLSGIEVLDDNRFLAVSDRADWFEGQLILDAEGALVGVEDVRTAPLRDENGRPFSTRESGDSEGLAQLPDGRFAVSFEQDPRVLIYDMNRDGPFGAASRGPRFAEAERLPPNVGLEALATTEGGDFLAGAEGGGASTPIWRVHPGATTPTPPLAHYALSDAYSLTSFDRLPNGDFVAIERFYAPVIGPRARITTFPASALVQGATITPHRLAEIAGPLPVDNFEGVSAVRMPNGVTRLYIVSDDNMSELQRTLLLAFDIVE